MFDLHRDIRVRLFPRHVVVISCSSVDAAFHRGWWGPLHSGAVGARLRCRPRVVQAPAVTVCHPKTSRAIHDGSEGLQAPLTQIPCAVTLSSARRNEMTRTFMCRVCVCVQKSKCFSNVTVILDITCSRVLVVPACPGCCMWAISITLSFHFQPC